MREADQEAWPIYSVMRDMGRIAGQLMLVASPRVETSSHPPLINGSDLGTLTQAVVTFLAEAIQAYIDAGSERDVTHENEQLWEAIYKELEGWSTDDPDFIEYMQNRGGQSSSL